MGIVAHQFGFQGGRGIVHIAETDAKFTHEGEPIRMCFHKYCGPMFSDKDDETIFVDDTAEFVELWKQFDGWWKAKGKGIYGR